MDSKEILLHVIKIYFRDIRSQDSRRVCKSQNHTKKVKEEEQDLDPPRGGRWRVQLMGRRKKKKDDPLSWLGDEHWEGYVLR